MDLQYLQRWLIPLQDTRHILSPDTCLAHLHNIKLTQDTMVGFWLIINFYFILENM